MSAVYVVKEKIEELQKKIDLALDEQGLRDFTREVVKEIVGIEVGIAKDQVHKMVSESADRLAHTQKFMEKRTDQQVERAKLDLQAAVGKQIEELENQNELLKYQLKILAVFLGIGYAIGLITIIL